MIESKLPRKPSALIRLALKDLEASEKQKDVRIDMLTWHSVEVTPRKFFPGRKVCVVCLAGAVMNESLGVPKDVSITLHTSWYKYSISLEDQSALLAIDAFRGGFLDDGLRYLGLPKPKSLPHYVDIAPYINMPKHGPQGFTFKKDMNKLADDLEKAEY